MQACSVDHRVSTFDEESDSSFCVLVTFDDWPKREREEEKGCSFCFCFGQIRAGLKLTTTRSLSLIFDLVQ